MTEFMFVKFAKGKTIFREGESGDFMYIILEGQVTVELKRNDERITLAKLGVGNFFGEMGLFSGESRSADVEALSDVKLLRVSEDDIKRLKKTKPRLAVDFLYAVCRELSLRLFDTDESLESYYYVNKALLNNKKFRDFLQNYLNKKED